MEAEGLVSMSLHVHNETVSASRYGHSSLELSPPLSAIVLVDSRLISPSSATNIHFTRPSVYMPIHPQRSTLLNQSNFNNHKQISSHNLYHHVPNLHAFDGHPSPLLALPPESLTQITSFLDPISLITLARTHSLLHRHVKDDNTWHQAFACQFLAQGPESDDASNSPAFLLLRRSEETWKKEFIHRWNLLQ